MRIFIWIDDQQRKLISLSVSIYRNTEMYEYSSKTSIRAGINQLRRKENLTQLHVYADNKTRKIFFLEWSFPIRCVITNKESEFVIVMFVSSCLFQFDIMKSKKLLHTGLLIWYLTDISTLIFLEKWIWFWYK